MFSNFFQYISVHLPICFNNFQIVVYIRGWATCRASVGMTAAMLNVFVRTPFMASIGVIKSKLFLNNLFPVINNKKHHLLFL